MRDTIQQGLSNTVSRLRKRIEQIRELKEGIGEQNTRATLIDPALSSLGWNLEELDEVSREYRRKPQDNPVDYALFLLRVPVLFVEAKALEKDLEDRKWVSQVLGYATVVGVEWCVLTNGDEYRIYNSHATVDVDEKLFRSVKISDSANHNYTVDTLDLLSKSKLGGNILNDLWKTQFVDRRVKTALHELFRHDGAGLIRLVHKRTPNLSLSEVRESLKRANVRVDFPVVGGLMRESQVPTRSVATAVSFSNQKGEPAEPTSFGVRIMDLIDAPLVAPPMDLQRTYKAVRLEATIQADGRVLFGGEPYDSLSTAAGMARKSVIGGPPGRRFPQTNGWVFWQYRDAETGQLQEIDVLRRRCLSKRVVKE